MHAPPCKHCSTTRFSSFASENTAETKAGEKPFGSLAFGRAEGDIVYARVGEEPFIVAVRKQLLEVLLRDVPATDLNLDEIADHTPGFVVADLSALVREGALRAAARARPGSSDLMRTSGLFSARSSIISAVLTWETY